jgi:hypothetical protein
VPAELSNRWTAESLRELSQQLRSFRNVYGDHYTDRDTDEGKANIGKLGDVIRLVDDTRAVAQRENALASLRSSNRVRRP